MNISNLLSITLITFIIASLALTSPVLAAEPPAAEPDTTVPTIQNRFATKARKPAAHLLGMTHIRNDLYNTTGLALDLSYYFNESLGAEIRLALLRTRLNSTAEDLRQRTALTPDAWPQNYLTTAGLRYSFGYGKILAFDKFVVHFDPQFVVHAGAAFADGRALPTSLIGLSLLAHFKHNIQLKLDLTTSLQLENRSRGMVSSFGFAPFLGLGYSFDLFNQTNGGQP